MLLLLTEQRGQRRGGGGIRASGAGRQGRLRRGRCCGGGEFAAGGGGSRCGFRSGAGCGRGGSGGRGCWGSGDGGAGWGSGGGGGVPLTIERARADFPKLILRFLQRRGQCFVGGFALGDQVVKPGLRLLEPATAGDRARVVGVGKLPFGVEDRQLGERQLGVLGGVGLPGVPGGLNRLKRSGRFGGVGRRGRQRLPDLGELALNPVDGGSLGGVGDLGRLQLQTFGRVVESATDRRQVVPRRAVQKREVVVRVFVRLAHGGDCPCSGLARRLWRGCRFGGATRVEQRPKSVMPNGKFHHRGGAVRLQPFADRLHLLGARCVYQPAALEQGIGSRWGVISRCDQVEIIVELAHRKPVSRTNTGNRARTVSSAVRHVLSSAGRRRQSPPQWDPRVRRHPVNRARNRRMRPASRCPFLP